MAVSLYIPLSALLLFVCGVTLGRCDVAPVCDPSQSQFTPGPSDPRFPPLPSQFSTTTQAVIEFSGGPTEITVREYFDEVGNRGRLEYAYNGSTGYVIYDYGMKELFYVSGDRSECSVEETTDDNPFLRETFGFRVQDGAPHIGTVSQYFQTDTVAIVFVEQKMIRGIPCNHWQSCFNFTNKSYTIDYYFSRNDTAWTSSYGDDPVPVLIIVNGTKVDDDSSEIRDILNIYTFVAFDSGPDSVPDEVFSVPTGLVCKGRVRGKPLPSLPNYFATFIEEVDENNKTVAVIKEFYDFEFQLFRRDFYTSGRYNLGNSPYTLIQDFRLETQYVINRQYRNCSVFGIEPHGSYDVEVVDGRATLISPARFFLLLNGSNYTYEGVSTARGVEVESWVTYTEFQQLRSGGNVTDTLQEVFFTRPDWKIGSHSSAESSDPTLWRSRFSGTFSFLNTTTDRIETHKFRVTYDFFAFDRGVHDRDIFDTSVCVESGDYYIVTLFLPVEGIAVDFSLLPRNVRAAIAGFTKIEPLQVGNIQVLGGNATALFLSLHISNLFNVSLAQVSTPVSASDAVTVLLDSARKNDNKLDFDIPLSTNGEQKTKPLLMAIRDKDSLVYHGYRDGSNSDSGLSDGAIAGIAIWMLVFGIGVGIIGTLVVMALVPCLRKRSFTLPKISYKKHEDEKVTVSE